MKIIPFGRLTEILPEQEISNPEIQNWNDLIDYLYTNYPGLKSESILVAVNAQIVDIHDDLVLDTNDEISLLPPFSGG